MRLIFIILIILSFLVNGQCQFSDLQIKVYDFDDGISHRNVFKIVQDQDGFIWVATINGLSRFDGYQFINYNSNDKEHYIPYEVISDMVITKDNYLWLGSPDFMTGFAPRTHETLPLKIKAGGIVRRESKVPHSLMIDDKDLIWSATYDEKSATTTIQTTTSTGKTTELHQLSGTYTKRPIIQFEDRFYIGAYESELWVLDLDGKLTQKYNLSEEFDLKTSGRIVEFEVQNEQIWILFSDGQLFTYLPKEHKLSKHPINNFSKNTGVMSAFHVQEDGDVWMGGRGILWYYNTLSGLAENYDPPINQIIKNTCYYRQIFEDHSGMIWLATDFGLIKINQARHLFANYLNGGSEYCSNVFCSTRGITEDEQGNIYIAYYNSIHVLNPKNNVLRLLFPDNDYFNYPFGLLHENGHLFTGNGRRINLSTLEVDTLFSEPNQDLGAVMKDDDGILWLGYLSNLYTYNPSINKLSLFEDTQGKWDSISGTISHLYQAPLSGKIWVSTLENGVFKIDKRQGRQEHYHAGKNSPIRLYHNQVNATYEDQHGVLWLATGKGIHRIDPSLEALEVYTTSDNGLPNDFINGILSEGDTCLWVSTDNGLCRFSIAQKQCTNFYTSDGLSSNEFNRISFFKARDGRMYFGGLNGVNAFYPGERFMRQKTDENKTHLSFTNFTYFDAAKDTTHQKDYGIMDEDIIVLTHNDKVFTVGFSLSDYRESLENEFSYRLKGYDSDWSNPSSINSVRYNNIPAGTYTFEVRARSSSKQWNKKVIRLNIEIKEAFYKTWWFLTLCAILLLSTIWGTSRYRIFLLKKREKQLEELVTKRTKELEIEKEKSESLLLNILPAEIAEELKLNGAAKAKRHELVTVMFSDFKGFTKISEQMDPEELVAEIHHCFCGFDKIIEDHNLEKIKTVGDAYLCVSGIAGSHEDDAIRVIRAALEIQSFMKTTALKKQSEGTPYFEARIGVHTGPLVAGIVGIKKFAYDIWGDTVNIAARMETNSEVGKVNVSETTYQLIKSHYECISHGIYSEIERRPIQMYFVSQPKTKD